MSFANQFFGMKYLTENRGKLEKRVYDVPKTQDQEIATLKLETMGLHMDALTEEQIRYQTDYASGT